MRRQPISDGTSSELDALKRGDEAAFVDVLQRYHGPLMRLAIAFADAKKLIAATSPALHVRRILSRNEAVATYTTPWGAQSDLVSADDVDVVEWPGMVVRQRLDAKSIVIDKPLPSSTPEGTEHVWSAATFT